ncbi:hypothetical protein Tco_0561728 [Tanacetum coccineum]
MECVGIKRLHDDLGVKTAKVRVTAAKHNLMLISKGVNTTYGVSIANTQVSPASTQVNTASTQVSTAKLSDETVYAFLESQPNGSQLSMRTRRFFQKTGRKITINRSDTVGYDKSKVECFNCQKMRHFKKLLPKPWWLLMELVLTRAIWQMMKSALMAFSDSEPEFEGYVPKTSKSVNEDISKEGRESPDVPLVKELVSDDKVIHKKKDQGYIDSGCWVLKDFLDS